MCGILGGTNPRWRYQAAVDTLAHRGPDDRRTLAGPGATLGFTRLAVIDVRAVANQPMASADGSVQLVFNGEIYGFERLRRQLEQAGLEFRTRSDTEVILNAYSHWGVDFVDHLDGMFALALYDRRRAKLELYRDRCGIKPLYYYWDGREFAFASELRALETLCAGARLSIDSTACFDFLTYRYVPSPKTLYEEVFKLPAAHRLTFDLAAGRLDGPRPYWRLDDYLEKPFEGGVEEACETLRALVTESVREQVVADVPLGFFLSGGIDSSLVVASAAAVHDDLQTFSIGFEPEEDSELSFARQIAERYRTRHVEEVYPPASFEDQFRRLRDWFGEPFADLSAFPTFCVSRTARRHVTVALSGDGGDELFGGYLWYRDFRRFRHLARQRMRPAAAWLDRRKRALTPGSPLRRAANLLSVVGDDELALYGRMTGGLSRAERGGWLERLEIPEEYDDYWLFRRHWRAALPVATRLQYLDFHTFLPDDILTKVDRVSMANSLEVRVPLLSRRLVEFAFSLPEEIRYCGGDLKGLLKSAYRGLLPASILGRRKRGFSMPADYTPGRRRRLQELVLSELFDLRA